MSIKLSIAYIVTSIAATSCTSGVDVRHSAARVGAHASADERIADVVCQGDDVPALAYALDVGSGCVEPTHSRVVACVPRSLHDESFLGTDDAPYCIDSGEAKYATWVVPSALPSATWLACDTLDAYGQRRFILSCDVAACNEPFPVTSSCSAAEMCAELECRDSGIDARGCRRTACATNADCPVGETCGVHGTDLTGLICGRTPEDTCRCTDRFEARILRYCL